MYRHYSSTPRVLQPKTLGPSSTDQLADTNPRTPWAPSPDHQQAQTTTLRPPGFCNKRHWSPAPPTGRLAQSSEHPRPHCQLCQEPVTPTSGPTPAPGPPRLFSQRYQNLVLSTREAALLLELPGPQLADQQTDTSPRNTTVQQPALSGLSQHTSRPTPAPRYLRLLTQPHQDPAPLTSPANQAGTSNQLDQGPAMLTRRISTKLRTCSLKREIKLINV